MNIQDLINITGKSCSLQGLVGCSRGWFFGKWQEYYNRPVLVIAAGPHEAEDWYNNIRTFSFRPVAVFPEWEDEMMSGSLDLAGERWNVLDQPPVFLVTTLSAINHKVIPRHILEKIRVRLAKGRNMVRGVLLKWLVDNGYDRTDCVEFKGEFAHRGGIVDIFPPHSDWPVRVELTGNLIESIRCFHPQTQCSLQDKKPPAYIYPADETAVYKKYRGQLVSIDKYLPQETAIVADEVDVDPAINLPDVIRLKELVIDQSAVRINMRSMSYQALARKTPDELAKARESIFTRISGWLGEGYQIFIFCNNEGEKKRLEEWLQRKKITDRQNMKIGMGRPSGGFVWPAGKVAVVSDEEIFSRYKVRLPRRKFRGYGAPLPEFTRLKPHDYVVHVDHGIGKYLGIKKEKGNEMLVIQYADKARLYVPARDAYLVERYIGLGGKIPHLHKLGGAVWLKTKVKVEKALLDMAGELLALQARRQALKGIKFSPDTLWQKEMEDAFIYEETPDQLTAIAEVKQDMESAYPVDRLICGDVGYGKTEVAVRAAFKAVMDGKQAAVLVPTTILAQQHYRTFGDRLADYPVSIEMLSRFRSQKEQKDIIKAIQEGRIDIVIGTHKLIQPDVKFKDLGLIIIDEEQRFGVRHKEYLKKMKELVDVIIMTATPIPRTLYMSLTGIRDMSIINTPPQDRLSVKTILAEFSEDLVRKAVTKELNRKGQVYFLHNRVATIDKTARRLQQIIPQARLLVGHGQMDEEMLALVMDEFVQGNADILVCTTIIQSGLDIPNVNTIFIDQADTFGLADLYQLRGRVGRYKHQAYAYLLLSKNKVLAGQAKKRLKAIQDFSDLGAGFKIAMQDLEIRGAGNILGLKQHGHIQAVGFDMYCKLLHKNVLKLQGRPVAESYEVIIDLDDLGLLPLEYIPSDRVRIDFYKRIASILNIAEIDAKTKELRNRLGSLPSPARRLLRIARIKAGAVDERVKEIKVLGDKIYITRLDGKRITAETSGCKLDWLEKEFCGKIEK